MHKLNIVSAVKNMEIKELRDLIYENCCSRYSIKPQKKRFTIICKQSCYYQSYLKKTKQKIGKTIKNDC